MFPEQIGHDFIKISAGVGRGDAARGRGSIPRDAAAVGGRRWQGAMAEGDG